MYDSRALRDTPDAISAEDRVRLKSAVMLRTWKVTILYEEMIVRYGELPYLLVRLAELRAALGSPVLAASLYTKAYEALSNTGIHDTRLDSFMQGFVPDTFAKAEDLHTSSLEVHYYQPWKKTREFSFPLDICPLPSGFESLETDRSYLTSEPEVLRKYLRLLIVETNHIEDTFLLTTECTHDIIRQGVSQARIMPEYESEILEDDIIRSVLNDTLEVMI
ncbi:hypothetical protein C0992_005407 [Termitomyces sp. T32_za158]|nr:hypothetical protein C0992_005407 [Termitomyces sp. T32_za158]